MSWRVLSLLKQWHMLSRMILMAHFYTKDLAELYKTRRTTYTPRFQECILPTNTMDDWSKG